MAVQYRGPNPALLTLTKELRARFGDPARTYEFVTGYKSPGNYSGHNPDSNGIVHAVDIFTDDHGNIPEAEGRALAERLRLIGKATGRFSYLIHDMSAGAPQPMIAGKHTNWEWVPYTGADAHSDHIHVSIADGYWGDPVNVSATITNDTSSWGIATLAGQNSGITPIPSEEDDMPTLDEIFNHPIKRSDGKGDITLASMLRYYSADIAGIAENVKPINTTKGPLSIRQAIADGRKASLEAASQTADINTATGPVSLRQFVADGTRAAQKLEPIVVEIAKAVTADPVDGA